MGHLDTAQPCADCACNTAQIIDSGEKIGVIAHHVAKFIKRPIQPGRRVPTLLNMRTGHRHQFVVFKHHHQRLKDRRGIGICLRGLSTHCCDSGGETINQRLSFDGLVRLRAAVVIDAFCSLPAINLACGGVSTYPDAAKLERH